LFLKGSGRKNLLGLWKKINETKQGGVKKRATSTLRAGRLSIPKKVGKKGERIPESFFAVKEGRANADGRFGDA